MRVSKTVREYIEKQVNAKLESKYAPMLAEEKHRYEVWQEVVDTIINEAAVNIIANVALACADNPFLKADGNYLENVKNRLEYPIARMISLEATTSVFQLREREAKEIVQNIIVELELGGTKADLERMLAEIEVEG